MGMSQLPAVGERAIGSAGGLIRIAARVERARDGAGKTRFSRSAMCYSLIEGKPKAKSRFSRIFGADLAAFARQQASDRRFREP